MTTTSAATTTVDSLRLNVTMPNSFKVAEDGVKTIGDVTATGNNGKYVAELADGDVAYYLDIAANNVDEKKVTIELNDVTLKVKD